MNVLFLDQFSSLGGAQLCLLDLLPALQELGWNATVAAPDDGPLFHRCEELGARVHRFEFGPFTAGRKTLPDIGRFAAAVPRLTSAIRDLIRQHGIHLLYVNGPRLLPIAAYAARLPIIFHCHSFVGAPPLVAMMNAALRSRRARVIACCSFVASPFASHHPKVIFNGVADQALPRAQRSRPRIGIIGRISPEKGHAEFIQAASRIPDCDFVVCGAATDLPYEARVRELARGLPVEFIGWRDDVASILATLDLLVVPSAPAEATTRVIPEAFSAGVPVIARRAGGIAEIVEDGETGFLIDSLEPSVLASACTRALAADCDAMSRRARRVFEQKFTLSRYRAAIVDVIRAAASQPQEQQRR